MTRKLHADFLLIADQINLALKQAISDCGPLPGLRPQRQPLISVLCRTIAGQQLSVHAARTIWRRVLADCGDTELVDYMLNAGSERLRSCGLSTAKSRTMHEIAQTSQSGRLDPVELKRLPPADRRQRLTAIWGVGPWTADMIGIFYFCDSDVWPENDITVQKTLQKLIGKRRKTTLAAGKFQPHRSLLARYMWKIADASPDSNINIKSSG